MNWNSEGAFSQSKSLFPLRLSLSSDIAIFVTYLELIVQHLIDILHPNILGRALLKRGS